MQMTETQIYRYEYNMQTWNVLNVCWTLSTLATQRLSESDINLLGCEIW